MATPVPSAEGLLETALITSLITLGIDKGTIDQRRKANTKSFFSKIDQKLGNQMLYFLFSCINPAKSCKLFRDCWPTLEKRQEAQFRSIAQKWFKDLRLNEECYPRMSEVASVSAVNTSHPKFRETILILACLAFHSGSSRQLIYCPRFTSDKSKNESSLRLLKGMKLFHTQNYIKYSRIRRGNLLALREKAKEMTLHYQKLISDIDSIEEEIASDSNIIKFPKDETTPNFEKDVIALAKLKNEEIKNLWSSVDLCRRKEETSWPKILALTNSTSGGLTTIAGRTYTTHLVGSKWSREAARPLVKDGKLDLASLFFHAASSLKAFIAQAKKEQKEDFRVNFTEERGFVASLASTLKEVKLQVQSLLPPLSESVSSLRESVDKRANLYEANLKEMTFCPPTPNYFAKSGRTPKGELLPSFRLLNLTTVIDERDLQSTPATGKSFKERICKANTSKRTINETLQTHSTVTMTEEESSPFTPFQKRNALRNLSKSDSKECSFNSPMESFNKILDSTKKYMRRRSSTATGGTPSPAGRGTRDAEAPSSGPTLSDSALLPSQDDEEEFKGVLERMALLDQSATRADKAPIVSRIMTDIETSREKNESKFLSFVKEWKKGKSCQEPRTPSCNKRRDVGAKDPTTSFVDEAHLGIDSQDNFSSLLSSFESKLGGIDFDCKLSFSKDQLGNEKCDGDEIFRSCEEFERCLDRTPPASLLPRDSLFNTLTEAVLVGEVAPSVVFDQDFDTDIRRESINKRESLMGIHTQVGFGTRKNNSDRLTLSGGTSFLLDDSGSCLISASFDSD